MKKTIYFFIAFVFSYHTLYSLDAYLSKEIIDILFISLFIVFVITNASTYYKTFKYELLISYKDAPLIIKIMRYLTIIFYLIPFVLFDIVLLQNSYFDFINKSIIDLFELFGFSIYLYAILRKLLVLNKK